MKEKKGFWSRIKGAGRKRLITAGMTVLLSVTGLSISPELRLAIVEGLGVVAEVVSESDA